MDKEQVEKVEVAHVGRDGFSLSVMEEERIFTGEEEFPAPAVLSPLGNVTRNLLENYAIDYRWPSRDNDTFIEIKLSAAFGTVWMRVETKAVHTLLITTKE